MKVCVIDPSLFTLPYDQQLCAGLYGQGVDVTLCGRALRAGESAHPHEYEFARRFYRWSETGNGRDRRPHPWLKAAEHVWTTARASAWLRGRFEVLHFQWSPLPLVDGWHWRRLARDHAVIFTVHDTTPFLDHPTSRWQRLGWRRLLDVAQHLIVHTRQSAATLQDLGIPGERIAVIPHGPLYPVASDTVAVPAADARRTLLVFGEIKPYKGIDVLLRAAARVPEELARDWQIVIAGRARCALGPLRQLAAESRIPVQWKLGYVPDAEIPALFHQAEAVVFPYRQIDASGALMLALPYARPVVATRVGVFNEMIQDGETGLLVPPDDAAALATALERVMTDAPLRQRIRHNLRAHLAGGWSWDHIAAEHVRVYRQALARRGHDVAPAPALTASFPH